MLDSSVILKRTRKLHLTNSFCKYLLNENYKDLKLHNIIWALFGVIGAIVRSYYNLILNLL